MKEGNGRGGERSRRPQETRTRGPQRATSTRPHTTQAKAQGPRARRKGRERRTRTRNGGVWCRERRGGEEGGGAGIGVARAAGILQNAYANEMFI